MEFGVVLQTNPPAARTVDLARQAETHGFDYVWTFDSHLLSQEPFVIYSAILAATRRVTVGPMVTNAATRDWTVIASLFATLNEMYGNRARHPRHDRKRRGHGVTSNGWFGGTRSPPSLGCFYHERSSGRLASAADIAPR